MKKLYRVKFFYRVGATSTKDLTASVDSWEIKEYNALWELRPYKTTEEILNYAEKNYDVIGNISIREEGNE